MSDLYTEVLVKKQQTGKDKAIKGVLIFFTVLFAAAGIMMNPLILLLALVLGIVDYIFIPKLSVEFEYLYVFLVRCVVRSTMFGVTSEYCGTRSTSSKVIPSPIIVPIFLSSFLLKSF